jgi:hypothetical protein
MQQRGKTCWGEGDYDHRANRERGASISYAPPTPRRWWSGTRGTAAPMHLGSGRGGAAGCGSRHTPLGGCSGIASGGYRSGQLQQPAGACISYFRRYEQDALAERLSAERRRLLTAEVSQESPMAHALPLKSSATHTGRANPSERLNQRSHV